MINTIGWISSIPKKIISSLLKMITFITSLFFVKLNLSTAENVTSDENFELIMNEILEKYKIEFLSRRSEVDSSRHIKYTSGFYTCFNKYLYFIKVEYGELLSNGYGEDYYIKEKNYITKSATIFFLSGE